MQRSEVALVVTCYNLGRTLAEALRSVEEQTLAPAERVVVDDGSDDLFTIQELARVEAGGWRVVRTPNQGVSAARNLGVRSTKAPLVVLLDADDTLAPTYLESAAARLDQDSGLAFVSCGMRCWGDWEMDWVPPEPHLVDSLTRGVVHVSSMFRRSLWEAVGGFDESLRAHEEVDFWTAAVAAGFRGAVIPEPLLRYRMRAGSLYQAATAVGQHETLMGRIYHKHRAVLEPHARDLVLAKESFLVEQRVYEQALGQQRLQLEAELSRCEAAITQAQQALAAIDVPPVDFGDLNRTAPFSDFWGVERGKPVDRPFIERFLDRHRAAITGRVLEVKDAGYAHLFGSALERVDVLDIDPANRDATVVADLASADAIPSNAYDCFILTQTLGLIFDVRSALRHAERVLRPGGVLLCTVPAAGRLSAEPPGIDGDHWRFTESSLRKLFAERFPPSAFAVESFGNVLAGAAFLFGLAESDVPAAALSDADPFFPIVYGIRAVKPGPASSDDIGQRPTSRSTTRPGTPRAAVLMYHRFSNDLGSRGLAIPPAIFRRQLEALAASGVAVRSVEEVQAAVARNELDRDTVAITIDDGYADVVTEAYPVLRDHGAPATVYLVAAALGPGHEFWWDRLDRLFAMPDLPPSVLVSLGAAAPVTMPLDATEDRLDTHRRLDEFLLTAPVADRDRAIASLARWGRLPSPPPGVLMSEGDARALARLPGVTIGAHTVHHPWLPTQTPELLLHEIAGSKARLESLLDTTISTFAYPYGGYDQASVDLVRQAGYRAAVTTESRLLSGGDAPLTLPRIDAARLSPDDLVSMLRQQRTSGSGH